MLAKRCGAKISGLLGVFSGVIVNHVFTGEFSERNCATQGCAWTKTVVRRSERHCRLHRFEGSVGMLGLKGRNPMGHTFKKVAAAAIAVVTALSLAACGGG